jgi:pilus assembly protein Flp/PilA
MDDWKKLLSDLFTEESGQDIVEYALVAAFVALASIAAISRVGSAANSVFAAVGAKISSAV